MDGTRCAASQLRGEMRAEFSAIRGEGGETIARLRSELLAKLEGQITGIRGEGAEFVTLAAMPAELPQEIRDGDEDAPKGTASGGRVQE